MPHRIYWLPPDLTSPGRLGLSALPSGRDRGLSLTQALDDMAAAGTTHIACLVTNGELKHYGLPDLIARYVRAGFMVRHLPIQDFRVPTRAEMESLAEWTLTALAREARILIHCVGGLGRSGLAAACCLKDRGLSADEAVAAVRAARSPYAVESAEQVAFVRGYFV